MSGLISILDHIGAALFLAGCAVIVIALFAFVMIQENVIEEIKSENEVLREKLSALENAMDEEFVFPNDVALERKNKIEVEENEKTESRIS